MGAPKNGWDALANCGTPVMLTWPDVLHILGVGGITAIWLWIGYGSGKMIERVIKWIWSD